MRLRAKVGISYHDRVIDPGEIFDALDEDALFLINQDAAHRFNLEDPSTITEVLPPYPADQPENVEPPGDLQLPIRP